MCSVMERLYEIDHHFLWLRFRTIIAIKRYGMNCNTLLYVSCVVTSPYNTPSWNFYELHSQSFPQKQVEFRARTHSRQLRRLCEIQLRIIVFSILRHIRTRPMPR